MCERKIFLASATAGEISLIDMGKIVKGSSLVKGVSWFLDMVEFKNRCLRKDVKQSNTAVWAGARKFELS